MTPKKIKIIANILLLTIAVIFICLYSIWAYKKDWLNTFSTYVIEQYENRHERLAKQI